MWVCHITGTPGCSTALCSVPLHYTQARYFMRTAEVTICIISKRLPDRPRKLPLHSLTAEAEGGNLCCSRNSAVSSSPHRGHTGRSGRMACQPCPLQLAEGISPTTGPGREGKKRRTGLFEPKCRHMVHVNKRGGGPTQPTDHHHPITTDTSADMYETTSFVFLIRD